MTDFVIMCRRLSISPFMKQCFVTATVDLTTVSSGSSFGFPAVLLQQLREPLSTIKLSEESESWIASLQALGMICGFFLTPPIMDRLGRKKSHYFVTVMFIIGWLITIVAGDIQTLIVSRTLHGVAGGLLTTLSTVLVGECTSPHYRGAFLTTLTLSYSTGILVVHFLGAILNWQQTALVCMFFPFASLIMSMYTPESPSWLLAQGKYDQFKKVFRWFRGDEEEEELSSMLKDKEHGEKKEATKINPTILEPKNDFFYTFKEVTTKKEFYKPLIIMIHCNSLMQFAGGSILITYSTIIVRLLMGPTADVYLWTVFMDIWRIFSNIVAIFVIHKFSRRTMIFASGGLCIVCYAFLTLYLYGVTKDWFQKSLIPVIFLSSIIFSNAAGIVPIRNVMAGELFPLRYRSIGGSISFATGSGFMFLILKTFPVLVDKLNLYGTYLLYGAGFVYNLLIIWFMLPETKGRTLLQIEEEFKRKKQNDIDVGNIELKA